MKAILRLSALAVAWTALCSYYIGPRAQAAEPAQAFVDGLRERGFYDYALEYLDRARSDPFVSDDFQQKILYEEGVTLVEQAGRILDARRQAEKLNLAQEKLQAFVQAHPQSPLAPGARSQLAKVLMARGRGLTRQTEKLVPEQNDERDQLLEQARQHFDNALTVFEASQAHYATALASIERSSKNSSGAAMARDARASLLQRHLVQSQLWIAEAMYERARARPDGDRAELSTVAERYKELYEANKNSLAGLHARLWQGRCYQDMGQLDKAIECYEELIRQEASLPALRVLVSKAIKQEAECHIEMAQFDEVILMCEAWLAEARGAESQSPDWLAVQYQLALAHAEKGRSLRNGSAAAKKHIRTARELVREMVPLKSEFQQAAKLLFAELGPGAMTTLPTTFDEAYEAATAAIDMMRSSEAVLAMARRNNPDQAVEIQNQFDESRNVAFEYFRAALAMADAKTDRDKVNRARFYLSRLNYRSQRYYDAAVLSEFLVRNYPENDHAREAAKVAIAAYQQLYRRSAGDRAFESARLVEIADYVAAIWPDEEQGDNANLILLNFAIQQGKIEAADQYLAKISPQRRAVAQLQVGVAYWNAYLRQQRSDPAVRMSAADLEALKVKAQTELKEGIERMRDEPVTAAMANAALSLAQIYLDTSQYTKAVALLEDAQIGPLTLVELNSPVVARDAFAEETYKAALRAFVSVSPPEREKALQVMDALEERAAEGDDPQAAEKLTLILISLGHRLQLVIEDLNRQGRASEAASVATAFEDFLERVSSRPTGGDWSSQKWIAQTYYNLAAGLDDGGALTQQTRTYYARAVTAYEAILEEAARDASFAPSEGDLLRVKIRLAECLGKSRAHSKAIELVAGILAEKPKLLEAQVIAARTYQNGGDSGEPNWYDYAIIGGHKDATTDKNLIWGWGRLSRKVFGNPKYRGIYLDARYNMNLCRLQSAMKQSDERRSDYLRSARDDLIVMDLSNSDDEWHEWRPRFEQLLKDVQRNMNIPATGYQDDDKASLSQTPAGGAAVDN